MIRNHYGGVIKPFLNPIVCNTDRVDTTKTPINIKLSNSISVLVSPLASWWIQMQPRLRGRVCRAPERVTASVACKGGVGHVPEVGGGKFEQYTEGGTASVSLKGDPKNPGYITFEPGGLSTIKWIPTGVQVSESNRSPRGEPSSDPRKKPTVLSTIPIPE